MKTFHIALRLIVLLFFVLGIAPRYTQHVRANSVCTEFPPPAACVMQEVLYTRERCDYVALYPGGPAPYTCWDVIETALRCTIPQSGGGSCVCCYYDGCYLNCPGTNPPGGNNPPDPPPPGSTPTPIPTPTPTPVPGTVRMRAVAVSSGTTTCAQLDSSTSYIASAITLYPPGMTNTTPVDGSYATWNNQPVIPPFTTYSFTDTPPVDYVLKMACWSRTAVNPSSGQGYAADLYSGSTITWRLGYTNGTAWWQTKGGDVSAASALRSYIPASTSPRYAVLDGSSGTPGVATYGTTYDFDSDPFSEGATLVSRTNWQVNAIEMEQKASEVL